MNPNLIGNIGESIALNYFVSQGYEVYLPFGTALSVDMIIVKDDVIKRVSVKSSTRTSKSGRCEVDIRQNTKAGCIPFNKNSCDMLFLYSINDNRFKIINSIDVKSRCNITI